MTASTAATPPPSRSPIPLPTSVDLAAAGGGVIWAYVGNSRLFVSTDRGATWDERAAPAIVNGNIAFIDGHEGWALSAGSPETGCTGQTFQVFHTTDGAATWQGIYESPLGDPGCKTSLAFVDAQRGYVAVSTRDGGSLIYRTRDGGRSWSPSQKLSDPPGANTAGASYANRPGKVADFGDVLLVNAVTQSSTTTSSSAYRSTDRGASWSYLGALPVRDGGTVFITASRWLQLVLRDSSMETTDGGLTWHAYPTDYQQAAPIPPVVVFGDAETGYATVRGSIQRTMDGGLHWTAIKTPGTLSP